MFEKSSFIPIVFIFNILIANSELNNTNIISFKFKTYYPFINLSKIAPLSYNFDYYYEKIHLSKVYLEIETGKEKNQKQYLNIIVDLNEIIFSTTNIYFDKNTFENNNLLCKYNTSKSKTFFEYDGYYNIDGIKTLSSYANEYFKIFTDIHLSKYNYTKLNFVNTINHKNNYICGNIGLTYLHPESHVYNFFAQLHSIFNLSDYSLLFNYSSKNSDEGILIFGNMPHIYLPNKFNLDNLISIYSINIKEPTINYIEFYLDWIKMDGNGKETKIKINPDIEGLEFPEIYFKYLEDKFFEEYYNKSICHYNLINRIYKVIQCDGSENKFGKSNIKSFPKISFYSKQNNNLTIEFNGDDLFYIEDNIYYFKIVENYLGEDYIIGRIIFKKYTTILNPDTKQIFFYINDELKKEKNKNYLIIIIISCIICVIIFFLLGFYFGRKIFKKRGKRAYELNDNEYEYTPSKDENAFL